MPIDPLTAKIGIDAIKGTADGISNELGKEKGSYKELFKYLRSMPKELITNVITIGPKFILLLIRMLKSKEKDAGLKLLFSGMIVSLSVFFGFMIWDVGAIALFLGTWGFLGPATAVGGLIFGSLAILIKTALTAFLVLVSMMLCNMLYTTDELNELAIEAFGKDEGKSFMDKFNSIISSTDDSIDKFISPTKSFFINIGKKKQNKDGNFDFSDIENKIKTKEKG